MPTSRIPNLLERHDLMSACSAPALRDGNRLNGDKAVGQPVRAPTAKLPVLRRTYLEESFPFRELSLVIGADRRVRDPVYGVHRWWARRPPALLRGLLIASHLEADATTEEFWQAFGSGVRSLEGSRVLDPFAGGGSTLVEAARLGANVVGGDVDPLAVSIVGAELQPPELGPLRKAGAELLEWLRGTFERLYPATDDVPPLHYFYVPLVECPTCEHRGPLYRNLVLARDSGRRGAVVRDHGLVCYCPSCFSLHHMKSADSVRLRCCGKHHDRDAFHNTVGARSRRSSYGEARSSSGNSRPGRDRGRPLLGDRSLVPAPDFGRAGRGARTSGTPRVARRSSARGARRPSPDRASRTCP